MKDKYKIDFALITLTGNLTRYLQIRPIVESDEEIIARWYPIRTWYKEDPLRILPGGARIRLRHFLDTWRIFVRAKPDAMIMHAFETYYIYALYKSIFARDVILINNPDGRFEKNKKVKFALSKTDLVIVWSNYHKQELIKTYPEFNEEKIIVLHPGLDLNKWVFNDARTNRNRKNLLFVAGDIRLKGGDTLLEAFEKDLYKNYDLHIATQSGYLDDEMNYKIHNTPNVYPYIDLKPGSEEMYALYNKADVLVHPTNSDTSSWVALEAMATGVPVIINPIAGISDIVIDGYTGLQIPPKDPDAIINAIVTLCSNCNLRQNIIKNARNHVENKFDASTNIKLLMTWIKELIDYRKIKSYVI